jgi:hypothetical protein
MSADKAFLKLRFFRDLSEEQRLALFQQLGEVPRDWSGTLYHATQNVMLDRLIRNGEADTIEAALPK